MKLVYNPIYDVKKEAYAMFEQIGYKVSEIQNALHAQEENFNTAMVMVMSAGALRHMFNKIGEAIDEEMAMKAKKEEQNRIV